MKTILITVLAACVALGVAAMPTKEEAERAEPVVRKLMASERAALASGKKTRSEVAAAAMKLAGETDTEAAKLLLMKGAFFLYVKVGNLEKAVETMNALEKTIADVPPQCVTNMIETALLGLSNKDDARGRLYKRWISSSREEDEKRSTIQSIIDGMINVPGRDFWLSETELTQGQWEAVMGYNLSTNKGVNLPAGCVSRDDCDVFLEKLNRTEEVKSSQFSFCLPLAGDWIYAAQAGSAGKDSCFRPGVAGNIFEMAWMATNSMGRTHDVAMKTANAF